MSTRFVKAILVLALVSVLASCGVNEAGKKAILDKYTVTWGSPTNTEVEETPAITFYTYTWDTNAGHAELVIGYSNREWSEVRFNSY